MKMLLLEEVRIEGDTRVSVDDPRLFTRLRRLLSTVLGASSVGQMFSLPPLCATLRGLVHKRCVLQPRCGGPLNRCPPPPTPVPTPPRVSSPLPRSSRCCHLT